jgi:hypothetical protein
MIFKPLNISQSICYYLVDSSPLFLLYRERISGGDYSFPSDIWGVGMTVLALAMGRYPFATSTSPRAEPGEGEGGYWAILQAIQERPSVGSLLGSCRKHCEDHVHSYSSIHLPTHTKQHRFSNELHSFLSMALHRDHKQRPSAQSLLGYPFLNQQSELDREKVASATEEFVAQCCVRNSQRQETRALSAKLRTAKFSARLTARVGAGGEQPTSAGRTADKNVQHRRHITNRTADAAATIGGGGGGGGGGVEVRKVVVSRERSRGGEQEQHTSSLQQQEQEQEQGQGLRHLHKVVEAYREYVNRAWGATAEGVGGGTGSATERVILNTLWPLMDLSTMQSLALNLNVPLKVVKKAFKGIVVEIRDKVEQAAAEQLSGCGNGGGGEVDEGGMSINTLLDKGFPEATAEKRRAVAAAARGGGAAEVSALHLPCEQLGPSSATRPNNIQRADSGGAEDVLDGSGSIDNDAFSVAELRALVSSSGGQFPQRPDTYRSTGSLTQRSNLATSLETAREGYSSSSDEGEGYRNGERVSSERYAVCEEEEEEEEEEEVLLSLLPREGTVYSRKAGEEEEEEDIVQEEAGLEHGEESRCSVGVHTMGSVETVPEDDVCVCREDVCVCREGPWGDDVCEESIDYGVDDDFESMDDLYPPHVHVKKSYDSDDCKMTGRERDDHKDEKCTYYDNSSDGSEGEEDDYEEDFEA